MKFLVLNGPNLNMLGVREPELYGNKTYIDLIEFIKESAKELGVSVKIIQTNYEGGLVREIQNAYGKYDAIVINPAAYTHTSIAIADALKAVDIPFAEVHLTDPDTREDFRKISYIRPYAKITVKGKGFDGYKEALRYLAYNFKPETSVESEKPAGVKLKFKKTKD